MNIEQKKQIVEAIANYQQARGLTQNKTAKELGINPSTLVSMRDESKWHNVSDDMWQSLYVQLGMGNRWLVMQTPNFKQIEDVCKEAKEKARMMAVVGKSGYGKTTALKAISGKLNSKLTQPNVYYVFCTALMSKRKFVEATAKAMGLVCKGDLSDIIESIAAELNKKYQPLLIFDDVGKLKWLNHQTIQLIYDLTEGNAGILLSGTKYLKQFVDKGVNRGINGFDEYNRRISYWLSLVPPRNKEVAQFCEMNGIKDKLCIKYIQNLASDYGTLRNIITNANIDIANNGGEIDLDLLESLKITANN